MPAPHGHPEQAVVGASASAPAIDPSHPGSGLGSDAGNAPARGLSTPRPAVVVAGLGAVETVAMTDHLQRSADRGMRWGTGAGHSHWVWAAVEHGTVENGVVDFERVEFGAESGTVGHGMVESGMVDHGMDHGVVESGTVDHGMEHGMVGHGMVENGMADYGMDHGMVGHGMVESRTVDHGMDHGIMGHGMVENGMVECGMVDHGMDHGMVNHDMVESRMVYHGMLLEHRMRMQRHEVFDQEWRSQHHSCRQ